MYLCPINRIMSRNSKLICPLQLHILSRRHPWNPEIAPSGPRNCTHRIAMIVRDTVHTSQSRIRKCMFRTVAFIRPSSTRKLRRKHIWPSEYWRGWPGAVRRGISLFALQKDWRFIQFAISHRKWRFLFLKSSWRRRIIWNQLEGIQEAGRRWTRRTKRIIFFNRLKVHQ